MIHEGFGTELEFRQSLFPGVSARRVIHEFGPWLCDALTATEAARARLREWSRLGCPRLGDELRGASGGKHNVILRKAQIILRWLPPPVIWYISSHCFLVVAGRDDDNAGWCAQSPIVFGGRLIVLASGRDETTLHEFSHSWLHGSDLEPAEVIPFVRQDKLRQSMELMSLGELEGVRDDASVKRAADILEKREAASARQEREANALERAWSIMIKKQKMKGLEQKT